MIWGCISHNRRGPLICIPPDKRKGADYVELILAGPLWDFYVEEYEAKGQVLVMEDGAPIHRTKLAKEFRAKNFMETIPHPAQSPDINPIEHAWKQLKTLVNERPQRPRNLDELWVALQEEWEKIDLDFINSLVHSMPKHVRAVYKV